MFCDTVVNEDDDNDCTYYETELGESYEFALPEDLDEAGHYKIQGKVVLPSGTFYTSISTFKVHCNL